MSDPRPATIDRRLGNVGRIIAVTGGKGGIGKSLVATTLALTAAERNLRPGLLDLDLTSPCDHVMLGVERRFPEERFGIEPLEVNGLSFMTVALFSGAQPAPLRGEDFTNALVELLAITRWGELDLLVIDMPPGIADAALDTIRLLSRAEHLVVATDSRVVLETVRRTLRLLLRIRAPVVGLLENMKRGDGDGVHVLARQTGVRYLGAVPFDPGVEAATGDPGRLVRTQVAEAIRGVAESIL